MVTHKIEVRIAFTPRGVRWLLLAGLFFLFPQPAGTSSSSLTSYYPSPSGIYKNITVTGNATIGRDKGNVILVGSNSNGKVGVGIAKPTEKLHIKGNLKVEGCIYLQTTYRCSW